MTDLKRSLRLADGLAMVVGMTVGAGIFRTPGLVAARLGRPGLTFVAWVLGAALAFLGALCFAELTTRQPRAAGKYVFVREAFGPRAGFVVGWVEALGTNGVAIAAIGVAAGEFLVRLLGWPPALIAPLGAGLVALFTGIYLAGVASGAGVQHIVAAATLLSLAGVAAGAAGAARVPERQRVRDAARAVRPGARWPRTWRPRPGQCRRDAVGGDARHRRLRDRARRHGDVRAAAGLGHRAGPGDRLLGRDRAVPVAEARRAGAVQRAGLSVAAAPVRRRVRGAVRGDGASATQARRRSVGDAGRGVRTELDRENRSGGTGRGVIRGLKPRLGPTCALTGLPLIQWTP